MGKYKIEFDREACIGAAACAAVLPEVWEIQDDGKPIVKIPEFDDDALEANMEAAKACPVNVIHIVNKETGERLI
ncbi:ferredoxin [Candidatus Woesearchaeota archaeon]|nr:MAG: ferredoxin [Candidatus Woesearchaeota archaeon]